MNFKKHAVLYTLSVFIISTLGASAAMAAFDSMLEPTEYTPANYIPPKYDAFDHDYYRPPVKVQPQTPDGFPVENKTDTAPTADFYIFPQQLGFNEPNMGTTETKFLFDGSASTDAETDPSRLEVRWYFENPDAPDTYFSRIKTVKHTFKEPGTYNVKMEVLDKAGQISSVTKPVTIVESTPPSATFVFGPPTGTEKTIFRFDTRFSRDDQFREQYLQYRFDWNGDGKWDTPFDYKTSWNHRFDKAGTFHVTMQAQDPNKQTATYSEDVIVKANTPPTALFTIKTASNGHGTTYLFDASKSTDQETQHGRLQFRWDFNYHGPNDIVADTAWNYSDQYNGTYYLSGPKTIRLEVRDGDGAIAYAFAQIEVLEADTVMEQYKKAIVPGYMAP